jgi:hypothetical protein
MRRGVRITDDGVMFIRKPDSPPSHLAWPLVREDT